MRKTKIVCTMGPSTDKPGILRQLLENGMDVARFNFSHGDYEEHKGRLDALRALTEEMDLPVAAMLDTKGPEIRLGVFANGSENLHAGQKFTLTTRELEGTNEICSVTYKDLPRDVAPGGRIMLDDGLIELLIDSVEDSEIHCTVQNDGVIKTKKGVNVPGVHLSMPYMSQRDRNDILFGIEQGFDLISASFTRNAQDIMEIRHLLDEHNCTMRIIAKIENQEGIDNIDEILTVADGIMVARGDMGVEIDYAEIPAIQKHLIDRAMSTGKICITATQMLDSMIVNPRPTRAEITDVANAIYDGTGAVMLSGETAAGKYPVEALTAICREKARMEEIARNLTSLETGYIRIGSIQSISYHWLPDILEEFSRLYPRIRFEMTVNGFQELKEKLNRKELDCIFVSQYAVPGLPFLPLGEDELMLAAPMDHPLSRKPAVSLSDIQQQNFILSADGLDYETGEIFRQNGITPVIRYRLNEDFATLKMVEKGFGITILPRLLLYHAPFQVCVRPFTEHYTRTLGIAYAAETAPSLAAERFMDFVKGWSQEHLPV